MMTAEDQQVVQPNEQNRIRNNNTSEVLKDFQRHLLDGTEVDFEFREPFIVWGYRKPGYYSYKGCFQSALRAHNETINVWSHIIALFGFLFHCLPVFCDFNPLEESFVYPLLSFSVGISAMFIMSSSAHLFNCMSLKVRHVCFFLDYAALSTYTFTASQVFFFYSRPTNSNIKILTSANVFLTITAAISVASTYMCCASRHKWIQHKFIIRTGAYVASWLINTIPFTARAFFCDSTVECNPVAFTYFKRQVVYFFVAALSNVFRIPERFMPGLFDFCGQSHHLMHILCSLGALDAFVAVELDMNARRGILHGPSMSFPTFANSIGLMLAVLGSNIAIVIWFAIKCPERKLHCHSKTE